MCHELFQGDASPANIEQASRLAELIRHEIKQGTFSYARHLPHSVKTSTFGHFTDLWLNIKRNEMAPSGFRVYERRAELHIRPKWGSSGLIRSTTWTCRSGCRQS
ncbi:Arm DNA-binding domain-containing protein [Pseudomonas otitidis]|uniref:Arm DNA-binding domain-containing protein n=1 Tax=Metapseudomonas otitidis TaxID=319939 RepID=UPI0036715504